MPHPNWTPPPDSPGPGFRWLGWGEHLRDGDEAWTWTDPDCTGSGWLKLEDVYPEQKIDEGHVPVRRAR